MRTLRRMRRAQCCWALPLIVSILLACDIHPFEDVEPPTLSNLQVGPGVTPTFSWTGDPIQLLYVHRLGNDLGTVWYLASESGMESPITYGIVPAGATEHTRVEAALSKGVTYRVELIASRFLTEGVRVTRDFTP